jgi:predicted Zn-ribbon and HTH transcriptional regulator
MAIIPMTVPRCRCERCGHEWIARRSRNLGSEESLEELPKPRMCPRCKSAWWDTPRRADASQTRVSPPDGRKYLARE